MHGKAVRFRGQNQMFAEDERGVGIARGPMTIQLERNSRTAGHYDMHARLADYDRDGVAAAVLLHGSQNGQPLPFQNEGPSSGRVTTNDDLELSAIGFHMYNQWLADVCTIQPERHIGLAHLPLWDIEASISELEWARDQGLRGVYFPAPQKGVLEYNRAEWEPFWSAAESLQVPLVSHGGGVDQTWHFSGPEASILSMIEEGGWMSRRHVWWMAFGGVFYRHPGLRVFITEISGDWWPNMVAEMDGVYLSPGGEPVRAVVPELPSEAARRCVFGAWWLCPHETEHAVRDGFTSNLIWGSDYPHLEGTWRWPEPGETTPQTHLQLRYAFGGLPEDATLAMAGNNAVAAYGLDANALRKVAGRINAMTLDEMRVPLRPEEFPTENADLVYPFRRNWSWS
jgi:predicted TIM-barrel fold metal-dependent hydrolase